MCSSFLSIAGAANRVLAFSLLSPETWSRGHIDMNVNPFVMAAQLDGNPCAKSGTTMTAPILHEGWFIKQYLAVRPPVANNNPPLSPNMCAP